MKWNMILGALVVSVSLSSQSFGFELLDRMLGMGGCGCPTSCCEKPCGEVAAAACCQKPACCPQQRHCHSRACCKPACDTACAAAPACGCQKQSCCRQRCGLLDGLFGCHQRCCKPACDSACGCPKAACCQKQSCCQKSCCRQRSCLLDIFRCNRGCGGGCASACGCAGGGHEGMVIEGDAAPMPPAPVVDPQALVPSKRRIVSASSSIFER